MSPVVFASNVKTIPSMSNITTVGKVELNLSLL